MTDNFVSQEVAWNLSQAIIDEIALRLSHAVNDYIHYDFESCFRNLKAIKMIVIANLDDEEREEFLGMEIELGKLLGGMSNVKSGFQIHKQLKFSKENGTSILQKLDEYSEFLMDTLKDYGYLIPPKEDKRNLNK